jgi:tetratricopeptide (TPR) repeat protein
LALGLGLAGTWQWSARPLERGRSAYRAGRWRDALYWANLRLKQNGDDREASRLLARASARLERDRATTALYIRLGSEGAEAEDFFLLGETLFRQRQDADGEKMWWKALSVDPAHAETLSELTRLLERTDRLAEAADLAGRLAALPGWEAQGAARLGLIRDEQSDPASAAEALRRALQLDPMVHDRGLSSAALRKRLARSLLRLGRPDEAEAELRVVLSADPDREAAWLQSRAALQRGDRAAALAAWRKAGKGVIVSTEPAPYVGSARCGECHNEIHEKEQSSRHARTFHRAEQLAALSLPARTYTDPDNTGVISTVAPGAAPATFRVEAGSSAYHAVIEYVLGSGRHAFTPIGRDDEGALRELRLTYYASISSWDRTPGQPVQPGDERGFVGVRQSDDSLRRCLNCHTTGYRAAIARTGPEAADRGIGCERCHGPGGNHLAAVEASFPDFAIEKFGRNASGAAPRVMTLCGGCHGTQGRQLGQDSPAATVRFQATTLTWSKCFEMSRGTLDCLTCHSAHRSADETPAVYEAKCRSCHSASESAPRAQSQPVSSGLVSTHPVACPVNPRADCLGCHMPKVPSIVPHATFTDHHIRVHRDIAN